ncbi:MAG: SMP-30/gluconolactonase/LRE family protein [Deltaproteobacteria bacterium]|nr:SMP-30/gluconolactonase/LRE family protein [Deltaproteobacteria bacterium]
MKKLLLLALLLVAGTALYVGLSPSPVDPEAYSPPPAPALSGVLSPNQELTKARLLAPGRLKGPEDVAPGPDGWLYTGQVDGSVVRVHPDGRLEPFAQTGGRPLGLMFDAAGKLIVCDADKGLLALDKSGQAKVLTREAEGRAFGFTDDLDIASDGKIYFSDASWKFGKDQYLYDLLEHRPHGRLMVYDPASGETRVLLEGLYFANGVALSQNEDYVLVNETYAYRIRRYWLKGPREGQNDVFLDNLPGFPDNISANRQGRFWLALFTVRNPAVDALHPHPWAKSLLARLPHFLWPQPAPYGLVLALDEGGRVQEGLHDPEGKNLKIITSAREHQGRLYLGSLLGNAIGEYTLPPRP